MFKSIDSFKPAFAATLITLPFSGAAITLYLIFTSIEPVRSSYTLLVICIGLFPAFLYWYNFALKAYFLCREAGFLPGHLGIIKFGFRIIIVYFISVFVFVISGLSLQTGKYEFWIFLVHLPLVLWWLYMLSFNSKALLSLEANKRVEKPGLLMGTFAFVPLSVFFIQKRLYTLSQK